MFFVSVFRELVIDFMLEVDDSFMHQCISSSILIDDDLIVFLSRRLFKLFVIMYSKFFS
jgi:hypothetical protein